MGHQPRHGGTLMAAHNGRIAAWASARRGDRCFCGHTREVHQRAGGCDMNCRCGEFRLRRMDVLRAAVTAYLAR